MVGLPPDDEFWQEQRDQLRIPRIAPITDLVEALRQQRPYDVPYVAPMYGGVEARLLTVVTSPGRQTRAAPGGTGFLCIENPDRAAATVKRLMSEADIGPREMTPWNACPWFTDGPRPTPAELEAGVGPAEPGAAQVDRAQLSAVEVDPLKPGTMQIGMIEVSHGHDGSPVY